MGLSLKMRLNAKKRDIEAAINGEAWKLVRSFIINIIVVSSCLFLLVFSKDEIYVC